jgi:hypothetical protein
MYRSLLLTALLFSLNATAEIPGLTLVPLNSGVTGRLEEITYGNGTYVMVGEDCLVSTNGLNWNHFEPAAFLSGVAYGNGKFVAVGGEIRVSTNGMQWETAPPLGYGLNKVAYWGGVFVAIGVDRIFSSTNGLDWTNTFYWPSGYFQSVSAGPAGYCASGTGSTFMPFTTYGFVPVSKDGFTWGFGGYPNFSTASGGPSSVSVGDHFFLASTGQSSKDGTNWVDGPVGWGLGVAVKFINQHFVVTHDLGIYFPKNGKTGQSLNSGTSYLLSATYDGRDYYFCGVGGALFKTEGPTQLPSLSVLRTSATQVSIEIMGIPGYTYRLEVDANKSGFGNAGSDIYLESNKTNFFISSDFFEQIFYRVSEL